MKDSVIVGLQDKFSPGNPVTQNSAIHYWDQLTYPNALTQSYLQLFFPAATVAWLSI